MLTDRPAEGPDVTPVLAAVIVPGSGHEVVPFVRQWVAAVVAMAGCAGDDLELAAAELVTNAVRHTRSGKAGGEVTVIVAAGPVGAVLHVHDQGATSGQVPHMKTQRTAAFRQSGRGLRIVDAISVHWAARDSASCPQAPPDDPAVTVGGRCVWCHIRCRPTAPAAACKVPQPRPASPAEVLRPCCPPLLTWTDEGLSLAVTSLCIRQAGRRLGVRQVIAHAVHAVDRVPGGRPPVPAGAAGESAGSGPPASLWQADDDTPLCFLRAARPLPAQKEASRGISPRGR